MASQHQPPARTTRHLRTPSAPVNSTRSREESQTQGQPQQQQPRLRPAFNNLQQHYSPAKSTAPKPLTSTYLAPPTPSRRPANVAASAETSRLQTELLQLHLLHKTAGDVDAAWRASARTKLGERFAQVRGAGEEVRERDRRRVERENVLALKGWGAAGKLDERIQALDGVVSGLWAMSEPSGRYARMVRHFERWLDKVCDIEETRRVGGGDTSQEQDAFFIAELDTSWKDECSGLLRRLDGWRVQLDQLGEVPNDASGGEQSSLGRMLTASKVMVHDMLAEIQVMEEMESEALAREDQWIEEMSREDEDGGGPRAGAIWRAT